MCTGMVSCPTRQHHGLPRVWKLGHAAGCGHRHSATTRLKHSDVNLFLIPCLLSTCLSIVDINFIWVLDVVARGASFTSLNDGGAPVHCLFIIEKRIGCVLIDEIDRYGWNMFVCKQYRIFSIFESKWNYFNMKDAFITCGRNVSVPRIASDRYWYKLDLQPVVPK